MSRLANLRLRLPDSNASINDDDEPAADDEPAIESCGDDGAIEGGGDDGAIEGGLSGAGAGDTSSNVVCMLASCARAPFGVLVRATAAFLGDMGRAGKRLREATCF